MVTALLELRADSGLEARISELRRKANEGTLTPSEDAEYKEFVEAVDLISVMQAKARRFLARQSARLSRAEWTCPPALRAGRAGSACEYCGLPQEATPLIVFRSEHIVSRQHGGTDDRDGLALSCDRCNAYKGPNLTSIDPETRTVVAVFNPRADAWSDHFALTRGQRGRAGAATAGPCPNARRDD